MMKKLQIIISGILVMLLLTACEKDIVLDIPSGEIDGVVEAWIYDGSGPVVMLSKQFSGYGTFNLATLTEELNIKDALVQVSENNGTKVQLFQTDIYNLPDDLTFQVLDVYGIPRAANDLLNVLGGFSLEQQLAFVDASSDLSEGEKESTKALIRLANSFNFYVDTSNTILGQGGSNYQLEIAYDGKQLYAETSIPIKQDINFLFYELDAQNPALAQVKMNLTVPDNFDAFILLATSRNGNAFYVPQYLGGGLSDNGIYAGSGTITLPLLRGYSDEEDPEIADLGLFEVGDTVQLKWQNIDEATFNFWFSVFNDGGDTPFSTASKIQSNIEGGFGIWAGYNTSYTTIIIQ